MRPSLEIPLTSPLCRIQVLYPALECLPVMLRPYYACQDMQDPIYSLDMLWSELLPALLSEMQSGSSCAWSAHPRHSC